MSCPNCGAPATPETRFCPKCGATIAAPAAPPAPAPYRPATQIELPPQGGEAYPYQPQPPQQPPQPPGYPPYPQGPPPPQPGGYQPPVPPPGYPPIPAAKGRSKAPMIILAVVVLLAATVGVLFATHVIKWPFGGSGPKDAVEKAHTAYTRQDVATFDKYVDLSSVVGDFFDQLATAGGIDEATHVKMKENLPMLTTIYKHIFFNTPTTGVPDAAVEASKPGAEMMKAGFQKMTYQGVDGDATINGKDATVKVKVLDSGETPPQTRTLELKLKDNGTNWQIVATANMKAFDPTFGGTPASPGPKEAVEQARAAYQKKDVVLFDKYVDLESVISDMFDQMQATNEMDAATVAQVKANLPKIAEVIKSIFFGTPTDAPPEMVQSMTAASGTLRTALEKVSFQGVDSVVKTGDSEALVKVKLSDSTGVSPKTKIMDVKTKDAGANWKVVSVPNLSKMDKE